MPAELVITPQSDALIGADISRALVVVPAALGQRKSVFVDFPI